MHSGLIDSVYGTLRTMMVADADFENLQLDVWCIHRWQCFEQSISSGTSGGSQLLHAMPVCVLQSCAADRHLVPHYSFFEIQLTYKTVIHDSWLMIVYDNLLMILTLMFCDMFRLLCCSDFHPCSHGNNQQEESCSTIGSGRVMSLCELVQTELMSMTWLKWHTVHIGNTFASPMSRRVETRPALVKMRPCDVGSFRSSSTRPARCNVFGSGWWLLRQSFRFWPLGLGNLGCWVHYVMRSDNCLSVGTTSYHVSFHINSWLMTHDSHNSYHYHSFISHNTN